MILTTKKKEGLYSPSQCPFSSGKPQFFGDTFLSPRFSVKNTLPTPVPSTFQPSVCPPISTPKAFKERVQNRRLENAERALVYIHPFFTTPFSWLSAFFIISESEIPATGYSKKSAVCGGSRDYE